MTQSKISWTNTTWEVTLGCTRVSAGCQHCYAERLTHRFSQNPVFKGKYEGLVQLKSHGPVWTGDVRTDYAALEAPLHWKKPRRVFVCSRSDLFHDKVDSHFLIAAFFVMAMTPQHTYQVLTKRPQRMAEVLSSEWFWVGVLGRLREAAEKGITVPAGLLDSYPVPGGVVHTLRDTRRLPNVWLGTSVEDQKAAKERIPHLVKCPAAVRFVSAEPLLGPVDLLPWLADVECFDCDWQGFRDNAPDRGGLLPVDSEFSKELDSVCPSCGASEARGDLGSTEHANPFGGVSYAERRKYAPLLDWVIVGGESGANARLMNMVWARELRDQCRNAGIAFYFKQQTGQRSNERPYLVEEDGRCFEIQQYPVNEIGGHEVTGEPKEVGRLYRSYRVEYRTSENPAWVVDVAEGEFNDADHARERTLRKLGGAWGGKALAEVEVRVTAITDETTRRNFGWETELP